MSKKGELWQLLDRLTVIRGGQILEIPRVLKKTELIPVLPSEKNRF
jgi:hypothetical protein